MPYGHASMLLLGEGSEATEPYNKDDKIRPHSIRSLQFDQKVRPLSFRPEKFDLFTATRDMVVFPIFTFIPTAQEVQKLSLSNTKAHFTFCRSRWFLLNFILKCRSSIFRPNIHSVTFRDERFVEFEGFSGQVELTGMLFEEGFVLKIKLENMLRLKLIDREMCI